MWGTRGNRMYGSQSLGKRGGSRCLVLKDVPTGCYVVYSRKIFFTNKMFAVWHHAKQPKAERCSGPSPSSGPVPAVTKEQVYKRLLIMSFTHVVQRKGTTWDSSWISALSEGSLRRRSNVLTCPLATSSKSRSRQPLWCLRS